MKKDKMRHLMTVAFLLVWPIAALSETLETYLARPGSHALVTIELPFDVLHAIIDEEIDDTYAGRKENTVDGLRNDVLSWRATTGELVLAEGDGALVLQTSAVGIARLSGTLGIVPIRLSADLELVAEVSMRPFILPDWSIAANIEGEAWLSEADLYGLSLRSELQPSLDRSVDRALRRLSDKLANPNYLRKRATNAWKDLCQNSETAGDIRFLPKSAAVSQPSFANEVLRISFVFTGDASLSDGVPVDCPDLPDDLYLLE